MSDQTYIHPDNAANEVAEEVQPARDVDEAFDPLRPVSPRDADSDLGRYDRHDGEDALVSDGVVPDEERVVDLDAEGEVGDGYIDVIDGRPESLGFDTREP